MKPKTKIIFAGIVLLSLLSAASLRAQRDNKIQGSWKGTIILPGAKLDLGLNIQTTAQGISASLDVPAQHAKGVPATEARLVKDSLFVEFKMMMARYRAVYKPDSALITGLWIQGGLSFPLRLTMAEAAKLAPKRPQEPEKPYAYNAEDVSFENTKEGVHLAGTLTWPLNKTNCPAVVLITGSGSQNRDEEVMGHKPFLVLADALCKRGIAVLRFDDRGVGKSGGDPSKATSADLSNDAEAAFNYLKTRKEVNPKMIGLAGHSEGGAIGPMIAARVKDVAFVVLLAGPGVKGSELLLLQSAAISKAMGMDEKEIKEKSEANKKIYGLAMRNSIGAADSISTLLIQLGLPATDAKTQTKQVLSPWVRYFLALDPAAYLLHVSCPVLALNGKKDVQVPYKENLEGIEKDLKQAHNKQVTVKAYEGLNHLFQHCNSGMVDEYATIEETMSPEVLGDIGDWILKIGKSQ